MNWRNRIPAFVFAILFSAVAGVVLRPVVEGTLEKLLAALGITVGAYYIWRKGL